MRLWDSEPSVRAPPRWAPGERQELQGSVHNLGQWVPLPWARSRRLVDRAPQGVGLRGPGGQVRGVRVSELWAGRADAGMRVPGPCTVAPPPNTPKSRNHVMSGGAGQCQEDSLVLGDR